MGEEAEAVLDSVKTTKEEKQEYKKILEKFDNFFKVRKNIIFERALFNKRVQQEGEPIDDFIMSLYKLVENCDYKEEIKDEMIRDRLVVGILDQQLSERMQLDPNLDIEQAKKMVRQKESIRDQTRVLKAGHKGEEQDHIDALTHRFSKTIPGRQQLIPQQNRSRRQNCTRCGRGIHSPDNCPAKEATCYNCHRKGHYSRQCFRSTNRPMVEELNEEDQLDGIFLDTVGHEQDRSSWKTIVRLQKMVTFKIDMGAEATVISEETYTQLENTPLEKTSKSLYGPSRQSLTVLGHFTGEIVYKEKKTNQLIYVIRGLKTNLLGLPAITSLNLVVRVEEVETPTEHSVYHNFPSLFEGLGNLGDDYTIQLKEDAIPHAVYTPRQIPTPLRGKVKEELVRMETMGVISQVDEPTPWCAGMVAIPKKNGTIRICVDLRRLNENVLREVFPLPRVDEALAQLTGAKIFSKLDANSGFWQIPLATRSRRLTTFITPFGRFCFNKLPFGISSAPEHYQKRMSRILSGLEGVICLLDDVLIFGANKEEHDTRLKATLERIQASGATLNKRKCEFGQTNLLFLGHVIDSHGIHADPAKTTAIKEMRSPTCVTELRRFMGMVNQLGKFSKRLADLTYPLCTPLSTKTSWIWDHAQEEAFNLIKEELLKPTILALYDPKAKTKVAADASSFGLGAVLLQQKDDNWRPIAFASRSLTQTESRYAQIEKEALACTWACEKFSSYLIGMKFLIETDHKPLIPILGSKELDQLPPIVLRFRLRLSRFDYTITHVPGKLLYTADALSRDPLQYSKEDKNQEAEESAMTAEVNCLPASTNKLDEYREAQLKDAVCLQITNYCQQGWPDKHNISEELRPYWSKQGELTICKGLLLCGKRIVVPKSMQREVLTKVHEGHQGIVRSNLRAQTAVWWPGIQHQISNMIKQCNKCSKKTSPRREPLIPSELPLYPWQKVATDLFQFKGVNYLLVIDYFSRYLEVKKLIQTTSNSIIQAMKQIFAQHGIPEIIVSDNGPQYTSQEFKSFADSYNFNHITSSPYFPQSNGLAERGVRTVEQLLELSKDVNLALLNYRSTPLPWCKISPAELLMGRKIRSNIPIMEEHLIPEWIYLNKFKESDRQYKEHQKANYDHHYNTRPLPPIAENTEVYIKTGRSIGAGQVQSQAAQPRSYHLTTNQGTTRRNRKDIIPIPSPDLARTQDNNVEHNQTQVMTRSRTGTIVRPPNRLTAVRKGDVV